MHELNVDVDRVFDTGLLVDRAVAVGVRAALRRHKALKQPIVVWQNGQPTWLQPDEFDPEKIKADSDLD